MNQQMPETKVASEVSILASASFQVLGVRIDAVQISSAIDQMEEWIASRNKSHYISFTNVHSVMEAQHDISFRKILRSADLSVPDGMPLVWLGRLRGYRLKRRVSGPDLLLDFCGKTRNKGYAHFFYGGAPRVAEKLAAELKRRFRSINIVGSYSPPFRPLTQEEDARVIEMINQADPDIIWVGLGCPKQERWIFEHRDQVNAPVMAGVGQAFDIFAGYVRQAPRWMRENGLEWLFRLLQEPQRLWRRYLICNTQFLYYVFLETIRVRSFE